MSLYVKNKQQEVYKNMEKEKAVQIIQAGLAWAPWTDEQKEAFIIAGEATKKQIPLKAKKDDYDNDSDSFSLCCPICNNPVGSLDNEDNDGIYKYNIIHKHCSDCGQSIQQVYSE